MIENFLSGTGKESKQTKNLSNKKFIMKFGDNHLTTCTISVEAMEIFHTDCVTLSY